jgi:hypothetical protein
MMLNQGFIAFDMVYTTSAPMLHTFGCNVSADLHQTQTKRYITAVLITH